MCDEETRIWVRILLGFRNWMAPLCDAVEECGAVRQRFVHGVVQYIDGVWQQKIVVDQDKRKGRSPYSSRISWPHRTSCVVSTTLSGSCTFFCSSCMRMQRQAAGDQVAGNAVDEDKDEVGRGFLFGVKECA